MNAKANLPAITGIGSVSPFGPLAGLIPPRSLEPRAIPWATGGLRRAFLVDPFRAADVVPGLKTRRLDRLSAWGLVAASLAIQDAGIDLSKVDRSRVAVIFATGFGCVELTESFFQSAAVNGWSGTDPITFPETLFNAPASHVALFLGLCGPNLTVDSEIFAGECALIQAASLIRHGQASVAIVLSGDTLTQSVYGWYEAADLLSPFCYNTEPVPDAHGFVPSEAATAMVLEPAGSREARSYARLHSGRWAEGGEPASAIRRMLGGVIPNLTICAGNGAPCATSSTDRLAREITGFDTPIVLPQAVAAGLAKTGGLLHLILALSCRPVGAQALLLATAGESSYAAIHLELS
ncbi:MAG: beta-ketoacyl synthase N-terminal-like domain-containing protein [Terracidiphilus sp.]